MTLPKMAVLLVGPTAQRLYMQGYLRDLSGSIVAPREIFIDYDAGNLSTSEFGEAVHFDLTYLCGFRGEDEQLVRFGEYLATVDLAVIVVLDGHIPYRAITEKIGAYCRHGGAVSVALVVNSKEDNSREEHALVLLNAISPAYIDASIVIANDLIITALSDEQLNKLSTKYPSRKIEAVIHFFRRLLSAPSLLASDTEDIKACFRKAGQTSFANAKGSNADRTEKTVKKILSKLEVPNNSSVARALVVTVETAPCGLQSSDIKNVMATLRAQSWIVDETIIIANAAYDKNLKLSEMRLYVAVTWA